MPRHANAPGAFTLVEILIVVVILGILAAIVVPQFANATQDSARAAFVSELRVFTDAAEYYAVREGAYIPDGGSGQCPPRVRRLHRRGRLRVGHPHRRRVGHRVQ